MPGSTKTPASIRHGGPGASHEDATKPAHAPKPAPRHSGRSQVSGGGGEQDTHHTHDPESKGET